ncbi:MAG: chitobiase/beta-hexosaminidase C-terminal domain-containing protein [Prevotella sp.]|nr:chitobiase/beta-hexosaminidase C-terminal domain-containing protein [Prevotella sp.]
MTISTTTDGATIYYTTDGTDPTKNSSEYTSAIPVSETKTIKAIAVADGYDNSAVATAVYTIQTPITIAAVRAQGTGSVFTQGIVTSCSGTTAYIQDATAAVCVYGKSLTIGDEVTVQGSLSNYNGLLEITSPTVTVLSSGNSITPTVKTIAEINSDYEADNALQGWLIKIENATVTATNGQNTTIAQGENTIVVRGISGVTVDVDDIITLTGNIGCYNAAQIANPTDVSVKVTCATPTFSPEAGAVVPGTEVTISTTTEDATIYYTTDESAPTASSTEYTGAITITEAVTIKAIAVKDGCFDSEVATAAYTLNLNPSVILSSNYIETTAAGADGTVIVTYENITTPVAEVKFYESDGETATTYDWIIAEINETTNNLDYVISENTSSEARTAYIKVYALDNNAEDVYSELITVTQAGLVVDYATLPFKWEGGTSSDFNGLTGVTTSGLGSDYAASNAPYRIKFDSTGDYIQIKTDGEIYKVAVDVKMLGGNSTSTITVQGSADGEDFTDVETLEISGKQNTELNLETTKGFATTDRYVRLYFTKGSNVGVGAITINLVRKGISDAGYATFCTTSNLDFTGTGVIAYKATVADSKVTFTEVSQVPANKGMLLKGDEGTYYIPVVASATDFETALVGVTTATEVAAGSFVLMNGERGVGFYKTNNAFTVGANTAYLPATASARTFIGFSDDTTTGISATQMNDVNSEVYDLQGRRVAQPQRGLYIVNGKKVVVK